MGVFLRSWTVKARLFVSKHSSPLGGPSKYPRMVQVQNRSHLGYHLYFATEVHPSLLSKSISSSRCFLAGYDM